MTPSQKRAKTIYLRNLDMLVKKIIIDNQNEYVVLLPKVIIEEILNKKLEKNLNPSFGGSCFLVFFFINAQIA